MDVGFTGLGSRGAPMARNLVAAGEVLDIVTSTPFASPSCRSCAPQIAETRYQPAGFDLRLGLEAVQPIPDAAAARGATLPAAEVVRDAFLSGVDQGLGQHDWSALAEVEHRRAGLRR